MPLASRGDGKALASQRKPAAGERGSGVRAGTLCAKDHVAHRIVLPTSRDEARHDAV